MPTHTPEPGHPWRREFLSPEPNNDDMTYTPYTWQEATDVAIDSNLSNPKNDPRNFRAVLAPGRRYRVGIFLGHELVKYL